MSLSGGGVGIAPATSNVGNPNGLTTSSVSTGITVATTNSTEGASATNANYQPYITVYMWKRTA